MLKKKLARKITNDTCIDDKRKKDEEQDEMQTSPVKTSEFFPPPFWKRFFDVEAQLNQKLKTLSPPSSVKYIYNPLEYAAVLHCEYLRKYLDGPKRLVFVGMNPGPNGMAQTGVPFGNVITVRDFMQLRGVVQQPAEVHPKRPIAGLNCSIEEPSGIRIWNLFKKLAGGSLDTFAQQCFVHNFCPLVFYDQNGRNLTPSELKGTEYKTKIREICLQTLDTLIDMLEPEIVVAVGEYVHTTLKKSVNVNRVKILRLPHPSPRSLNNTNWPEKAELFLKEHDLIKYIENKI